VRVSGRDPFADFDSFRGRIAIVFQNDRLLPWRTAIQNVELGLRCSTRQPRSANHGSALADNTWTRRA